MTSEKTCQQTTTDTGDMAETPSNPTPNEHQYLSRRQLLTILTAGGTATATMLLPNHWRSPITGTAIVPSYVQVSNLPLIFDLANDWSDTSNPNGVWQLYKAPGQLFTTHQADWYGNDTNQPGWADETYPKLQHVPVWMKTIADMGTLFHPSGEDYSGYVDAGTIVTHGAETERTGTEFSYVAWTSPYSGTIKIAGSAWVAKVWNRPMIWELKKNGMSLTHGTLTQADPYTKMNPFDFANGSGGAAVLDMMITQNDVIELQVYRQSSATSATFVAVTLKITLTVNS